MPEDVVYVPRVIEYDDNQPLDVEGPVVAVLKSSRSSRRITVLVEEPAERHESPSETSEGIRLPDGFDVQNGTVEDAVAEMGYRDLQSLAGQLGIKANQSQEELTDAVLAELN